MAKILIIDDDRQICKVLASLVRKMGHEAICAYGLADGLDKAGSDQFDAVFLDVRMPDGSGLDILPKIRAMESPPEVIIMTGFTDDNGAEIAIKNGAWDYIQKPFTIEKMTLPLTRVLQYRDGLKKIRKPAPFIIKHEGIIGNSTTMRVCLESMAQAAVTDANVLITGETGTGKELFAKAILANSQRSQRSFVVVDCASIPATLIESTLFGSEKGAYTGADCSRTGLIKQADTGTLFLDEVGELPLSLQKTFLRTLQEHKFRPVGGKNEIQSDFRLISATNCDLEKMVEEGHFRKDLYYRIRSTAIVLPPLRQRLEDIKDLVFHYMARICDNYGIDIKGISPDFYDALYSYQWPGNVRELIHSIEEAIIKARNESTLYPKHLPDNIRLQKVKARERKKKKEIERKDLTVPSGTSAGFQKYKDYKEALLTEGEKKYLQDLISLSGGSIKKACTISGLSRTLLYNRMKKYNISRFGWDIHDKLN